MQRSAGSAAKKQHLPAGALPPQVIDGCVLMYKVAELNPACMPWVSEWRLGTVRGVVSTPGDAAETKLQMAPWPDEDAHPLKAAWEALGDSADGAQVLPSLACTHANLLLLVLMTLIQSCFVLTAARLSM
jgi:hypothetical protein